jgi:hypothetical protein
MGQAILSGNAMMDLNTIIEVEVEADIAEASNSSVT